MNNKKGSLMVEAAIIYPLVIGAIMAVIYIMICMYTGAAYKANLDIELRNRAFEITQTGEKVCVGSKFMPYDKYGKSAFNKKICFTEDKKLLFKILCGDVSHRYKGNVMMSTTMRNHQGQVYLIDEKDFIRKVDMGSK